MDENKYDSCYKWFECEIKQVGLKEFEMVRSKEELSKKDFSSYSAIFIGGGNTYKLLSDIKACSNYEKIVEYIKNGGTVFGGSAGAIIFGKDIDCCSLDDKNKIGLKDTRGFNLLSDYSILCHLNNKNRLALSAKGRCLGGQKNACLQWQQRLGSNVLATGRM